MQLEVKVQVNGGWTGGQVGGEWVDAGGHRGENGESRAGSGASSSLSPQLPSLGQVGRLTSSSTGH